MFVNIKRTFTILCLLIIISSIWILNKEYVKKPNSSKNSLQRLINEKAGKTVVLSPNESYKINSTLKIPDNTTIIGENTKIYNRSNNITLLSIGNNVKIYNLEIEGAGNHKYNDKAKAIEFIGTPSKYSSSVILENCNIHDIGGFGLYFKFARNITINNCRITKVGYAGIHGLSVENVKINNTKINQIGPGKPSSISDKNIAYGITFTQSPPSQHNIKSLRSKNCVVMNSIIENNATWEALNTHGGVNISFLNNIIKNCKYGISAVPIEVKNPNGISIKSTAPQNIKVIGNKLYGTGKGSAVVIQGAYNANPIKGNIDVKNPIEYVKDSIIAHNTSIQFGEKGNNSRGAIYARETLNLKVYENDLYNSYMNGITIHYTNRDFIVKNNKIEVVQVPKYEIPIGISVKGTFNRGLITTNKIKNINNAQLIKGIHIESSNRNKITTIP
ncbi:MULTISPECIES: right-handed parallel beta-helix repeat-containing protein [Priestia]|uniref:right-handed parallel beta-helix repeat-containing protein n=1 Tax=Priestia sp. FSL P4-0332 TaxID=2921634 RepID=UPI0030F5968E